MPWAHLIMKVNSLSHIFNVATTVTLMDVPCLWASLVTQTVKNLPAKQETWVQSIFTRLFCFIVLCNVMFFSVVMYGCELDYKESWVPKNWCFWTVVLEETLESPLDCKEIQPVHPKGNQSWIFIGRIDAEAELQYFGHLMWRADSLEKTLMLERLKAGEGDDRGWDGWMASPTQLSWVWANSESWWWTEKPGLLQSLGSKRVRYDWATELNWIDTVSKDFWFIKSHLVLVLQVLWTYVLSK